MQREINKNYSHILTLAVIGTVIARIFEVFLHGSSINSFLFLELNYTDSFATHIDEGLALVSLIYASALFFRPRSIALVYLSLWLFSISLFQTLLHSSFAYEMAIPAHIARWSLPIALILFDKNLFFIGHFLLRLSIGLTFIFHGIEAFGQQPQFIDYLYYFFEFFNDFSPAESSISLIMNSIGALDILVGLLIVIRPSQPLYYYMFFWGLLTALIRIPYHGTEGWLEFSLRAPHWLIPFSFITIKSSKDVENQSWWKRFLTNS